MVALGISLSALFLAVLLNGHAGLVEARKERVIYRRQSLELSAVSHLSIQTLLLVLLAFVLAIS